MNPSSKAPLRGVRVGAYARYSSDRQSEHSIEDQLRICRAHAEREGWQLVRCFSDAAISGTTLQRPGLQALQLAMRAGEIDIILTEALDRLSRDQEHIAALHKLAGYTGVRLVTLSEGEVGSIHVGLRGAMSAMYLEDLVAKTMRGIEGRVRAGRAMGAPPYGYRRTTAVLRPDGEIERGLREIDPEHATVVRRIFECFVAGMTPGVIARMLNTEGVPAPKRAGWTTMTLRGRPSHDDGMLRNRHYIGELVWKRRHRIVDPMSGEAHRLLNPAEAQVVGLVPELRIIDDQLWAAAQAQLITSAAPQDPDTGRQRFWEKRRPRYLLSGKVICGTCDGPFSVHRAREYRCNGATRGLCANRKAIKRQVLETRVLAILAEQMMDPKLAEAFAAEFTAEWNRLAGQQVAAEGHLRRELEGAERKLGNLLDAVAEGIRGAGLQAKLSAAEAEVERLRRLLAEAKPTPVRLMPNLGHAYRRTVARLREALTEGNNPEAIEAARALIDRVIIHPTPRGTPPRITVEGHLAQMLTAAQPDLPPQAAKAIATAAVSSVKEGPGGSAPGLSSLHPRPGLRHAAVVQCRGDVMAEPLSRVVFDAVMARAGIVLSEAEAEGVRAASAHVQRFAAAVRVPRPVSAEPAVVFSP